MFCRKRPASSLIELLVVVSIVALLMPVIDKARRQLT